MADDEPQQKRIVLNDKMLMPVGLAITIVAAVLGLHLWLSSQFDGVRNQLNLLDRRMATQEFTARDR